MFGDPHGIEILGIYESHDSIISFLDLTKGSLAIALLMGKHHGFKLADTKQEDWNLAPQKKCQQKCIKHQSKSPTQHTSNHP